MKKIRKNTYLAGEALVKDADNKFSDEQIMFISQVVAEWTFHKTVDLIRSGISAQYLDNIIEKIVFTTLEVAKQSIIKQIPQEKLLQAIEYNIAKVYKQCIDELEQKKLITKEIKERAESQSSIDALAQEIQKNK